MMAAKKQTRESIRRAYKAETDAAWEAMSKRWQRALNKMQKDLEALAKAEVKAALAPHREK